MNFGSSVRVSCFCTIDQSGHDYRAISSMHIDRLIAAVRFRLQLISLVSCTYFSLSLSLSLSFVRFSFLYSILSMCPRYVAPYLSVHFSLSMSEQPQCRYNLHKTLWPRQLSANLEIYSRQVYRHWCERIDNRKRYRIPVAI